MRDLDHETFENLCFHILKEKYPTADIKHVDGEGGDSGIDVFSGNLTDGPTIWQCKHFTRSISKAQKRQVTDSLQTALRNFRPRRWVLCVPVDLRTPAHQWFQDLTQKYASQVLIELFQGSDIENELVYRKNIREAFFPGLDLEVVRKVSEVALGKRQQTIEQLSEAMREDVNEYLRRLEEKDARFKPRLTLTSEFAPPSWPDVVTHRPEPGLVMTFHEGQKRIDFFARDHEALRLDPPRFSLVVKDAGVKKLEEFLKLGLPQEFAPNEVVELRCPLNFPMGIESDGLIIKQFPALGNPLNLQINISNDSEAVVYEAISFVLMRSGTEEVEIATNDDKLPGKLSLIFQPHLKAMRTKFNIHSEGRWIREVVKLRQANRILSGGGRIELSLAGSGEHVAVGQAEAAPRSTSDDFLDDILNNMLEVSETFGVAIQMTGSIDAATLHDLAIALEIARKGQITREDIEMVTYNLVNDKQLHTKNWWATLSIPSDLHITSQPWNQPLRIMGTVFDPGPCDIYFDKVELCDWQQTKETCDTANNGEPVQFKFKVLAPVQFWFQRFASGGVGIKS